MMLVTASKTSSWLQLGDVVGSLLGGVPAPVPGDDAVPSWSHDRKKHDVETREGQRIGRPWGRRI